MSGKTIDPVCGMEVDALQHALEFEGIRYAFCSRQCRERFGATPHLYVGVPGHPAPAQQGKVVRKRRRFRTETTLNLDDATTLRNELKYMMGVDEVEVDGDMISVTYDLLQVTAEQLEKRMAEIGLQIGGSWQEKLRSAFVHYLEECEVDNMAVEHHPHRHG